MGKGEGVKGGEGREGWGGWELCEGGKGGECREGGKLGIQDIGGKVCRCQRCPRCEGVRSPCEDSVKYVTCRIFRVLTTYFAPSTLNMKDIE